MKVEAEVKIKILDGEEKGKVDTFRSIGETETQCTEYGIIERLRLEWRHIHNVSSWGEPCEKETIKVGDDFFVEPENPDLTGIKDEIEKLEKFYERVSSTMSNYEKIMARATLVELRARLTMLEMKMKTRSF